MRLLQKPIGTDFKVVQELGLLNTEQSELRLRPWLQVITEYHTVLRMKQKKDILG